MTEAPRRPRPSAVSGQTGPPQTGGPVDLAAGPCSSAPVAGRTGVAVGAGNLTAQTSRGIDIDRCWGWESFVSSWDTYSRPCLPSACWDFTFRVSVLTIEVGLDSTGTWNLSRGKDSLSEFHPFLLTACLSPRPSTPRPIIAPFQCQQTTPSPAGRRKPPPSRVASRRIDIDKIPSRLVANARVREKVGRAQQGRDGMNIALTFFSSPHKRA